MVNIIDKRIWAAIGGAAILAASVVPAFAAHEAGVSATVTPQLIAVSVDTSNVNYGFKDFSASDGSRTTALSGTIIATNDGNVAEDFGIKGADSTSWTLNFDPTTTGTVGVNQFVHRFDADATFTAGTAKALSTSSQELGTSIVSGGSGTQDFVLQMNMPLSGSTTGTQTTIVTVVATATP